MSAHPTNTVLQPLVARMHPTESRSRRLVLVAKVTEDIPAGAYVALVDVRGELFLRVLDHDDLESAGVIAIESEHAGPIPRKYRITGKAANGDAHVPIKKILTPQANGDI